MIATRSRHVYPKDGFQFQETLSRRALRGWYGRAPAEPDKAVRQSKSPGEQGEADASRVIHASGFDTTLDVPRELFAKNQILSADRAGRAQERDDQPQDVRDYPDECSRQLQHALIMPESARVCRCLDTRYPRRELLRTTRRSRATRHRTPWQQERIAALSRIHQRLILTYYVLMLE